MAHQRDQGSGAGAGAGVRASAGAAEAQQGVLEALTHLWNCGLLSAEEFNELRARAGV